MNLKNEFIELCDKSKSITLTMTVGGVKISGIDVNETMGAYDLGESVEIQSYDLTDFEIADKWFKNCRIDRALEESDGQSEAALKCDGNTLFVTFWLRRNL